MSGAEVFGDGRSQTTFHLHVALALQQTGQRLVKLALQGSYFLFDCTKAALEVTLDFVPQAIFQMSVDHSSLLRPVNCFVTNLKVFAGRDLNLGFPAVCPHYQRGFRGPGASESDYGRLRLR